MHGRRSTHRRRVKQGAQSLARGRRANESPTPDEPHMGHLLLLVPARPAERPDDEVMKSGRPSIEWRTLSIDATEVRPLRRVALMAVGTAAILAALLGSAWALLVAEDDPAGMTPGKRSTQAPADVTPGVDVTTPLLTASEAPIATVGPTTTSTIPATTASPATPPQTLPRAAPPAPAQGRTTTATTALWGPLCGFRPGTPVDVKINGQPTAAMTADRDGCVSAPRNSR